MSARGWILAALALTVLPAGCATTHEAQRPASTFVAHKVDVQGTLVLSDGRAVAAATVLLRCDEFRGQSTTDREGRFAFSSVPAGRCTASVADSKTRGSLRLRANLLRGAARLRLVVPPLRRVTVRLGLKLLPKHQDLTFDEALPGPERFTPNELSFRYRFGGYLRQVKVDLKTGKPLLWPKGATVEVLSLTSRPVVPLALRTSPPRLAEVRALPVRRNNELTTLGKLLGARSVLWIGSCARVGESLKQDLAALASYRLTGLRAVALATDACKTTLPRRTLKSGQLAVVEGGPAVRWALGAKDGDLLVLDESGKRLWQRAAAGEGTSDSAVQGAVSFLRKSWPLFAATQQVSVRRSTSVSSAEAQRNLSLAAQAVARGDIRAAHAMLDRVLALSPDNAEARKQRTLLKAQLGDITGAMSEVGYWRETYGDEAADELLDLVQKKTSAKLTR